jgi:hypothetical protein
LPFFENTFGAPRHHLWNDPTTPYCTNFNKTGGRQRLEFHLHPAILLVDKQVSAEATRVLYQENHFIILETIGVGLYLDRIPEFRRLPESRVMNPVLRIDIAIADASRVELVDPQKCITTLEGLQSIIDAIWRFDDSACPQSHEYICHNDVSLSLNYNPKAVAQYHFMNELVLRPWNRIHGLKKLELTSNIEKSMREHLERSNLEGPFPDEVATHLAKYHSLAEREFERKDYNAARWWCNLSDDYREYVVFLGSYRPGGREVSWQKGDELWDVLMKTSPMFYNMRLKLVKACLRQLKYKEAIGNIYEANKAEREADFVARSTFIMQTKFNLSACLAHTARGYIARGLDALDMASFALYHWSLENNINETEITEDLITEDLKVTLNNELICLKSPPVQ